MKIEIIPMSKSTTDGKWVPEARIRIHDGEGVTDRQVFDGQNRLPSTEAEANLIAVETARAYLRQNPAG